MRTYAEICTITQSRTRDVHPGLQVLCSGFLTASINKGEAERGELGLDLTAFLDEGEQRPLAVSASSGIVHGGGALCACGLGGRMGTGFLRPFPKLLLG